MRKGTNWRGGNSGEEEVAVDEGREMKERDRGELLVREEEEEMRWV